MSTPIDDAPPLRTVAGGRVPAIIPPLSVDPTPPTVAPGTSVHDMQAMFDQLRGGMPRASGLVFDWCVTEAVFDLEPTIIKAQFGDGYAQRRPAGINTQARKWALSMKNTDAATANAVLAFLSDRNGVDIFTWTPPRTSTPEDVICPSWNLAYGDLIEDGSRLFTVTMKFEEAYV